MIDIEKLPKYDVSINVRSLKLFRQGKPKKGNVDRGRRNVLITPLENVDDFATFCLIDGSEKALVYAADNKIKQNYSYKWTPTENRVVVTAMAEKRNEYSHSLLATPKVIWGMNIKNLKDFPSVEFVADGLIIQPRPKYPLARDLASYCHREFSHVHIKCHQNDVEKWENSIDELKKLLKTAREKDAEREDVIARLRRLDVEIDTISKKATDKLSIVW